MTQPRVLLVCVHNAGRSEMAAGLVTLRSGGRARAVGPIGPGRRVGDVRAIRDDIDARVTRLLAQIGGAAP